MRGPVHVVVVGGGIAGITAARAVVDRLPDAQVSILEASERVGGKLASAEVAGISVDVGAESMLNRRPEAVGLAREAGLAESLVHPEPVSASLWTRGALRPLPPSVMGVPSDMTALARSRVLSAPALLRARTDLPLPTPAQDVSVAAYVGHRLGREVVDVLVEPLLGGVYAGHASELSVRAAAPAIWALHERGSRLARAASEQKASAPADLPPVFAGLDGGLWQLPVAAVRHPRVNVRTGETVREASPLGHGRWRLVVGPANRPWILEADALVLATPAAPTARLVAPTTPVAARLMREIEYASMAIVTLAVPREQIAAEATTSGFLVPPVEGRAIKAATFSSWKWGWLAKRAGDVVVLRASLGRAGEEHVLQRDDADLVALAVGDLGDAVGLRGPLADAHVQRWGGGLPQYTVGHLTRVAQIATEIAATPGLEVCGAAYEGVGIPAVIASARAAADRVCDHLEGPSGRGAQ
ncbi:MULTISPECIES: protoporphyrinogen oxidase [Mumia]|uniref:protoporphyrinogen oxidase n=1 Tax=Mumia TaxID=1546255 RepID=UPI00141E14B0|nr:MULTISPECIES: protoporphyrinogen oxidase [unclassified Mumia]QMW67877.1 protoporphyrinogen oxidase [Mumia sp. ZJ1417]